MVFVSTATETEPLNSLLPAVSTLGSVMLSVDAERNCIVTKESTPVLPM